MKKTFLVTIIIVFLNLTTTSASVEDKGKTEAKKASSEVHAAYFSCYALHPQDKNLCIVKLNNKYLSLDAKFKDDSTYAQDFQYEAEKLGFLKFLVKNNKPCSSIDFGPIYNETRKAYKIECNCNHQYFIRYNYKDNEWQILN